MRILCVAVAVLAGLAAGCTEFAFVRRPFPQMIGYETWRDVPEDLEVVRAKVGDVLHLPLGPMRDHGDLPIPYTVSINGKAPGDPVLFDSGNKTSYVFFADKPGKFDVESADGLRAWRVIVGE